MLCGPCFARRPAVTDVIHTKVYPHLCLPILTTLSCLNPHVLLRDLCCCSGQWNTLACYDVGLSVNFIAANRYGLPLLAAGSQLLLLSNMAAVPLPGNSTAASGSNGMLALPPAAAAPAGSSAAAEAPSAAVAAVAGWDSDGTAAAAATAAGSNDASGVTPCQTLAALSAAGSMLAPPGGIPTQGAQWGLVNLCRQLQPVQPLRVPGGPSQGAWLSGRGTVLATHAALAAAAGSSSLPLYHPDVLLLLLGQGRLAAAARILRCVLEYVIKHKAGATGSGLGESAAAVAAMAAGSNGSSGGCSAALEALLGSEDQQGGALGDSEVVSRCCSFRDAVVTAALGQQPPGIATAAAASAGGKGVAASGAAGADSSILASDSSPAGGSGRLGHKPPAAAAAVAADWGPLKPAVAPAPASAAAVAAGGTSLDTGMLDMSAFGDFGGFGVGADEDDWGEGPAAGSTTQQHEANVASGSAAAAAAAAGTAAGGPGASSSNALETGMLDMSAFGGFGDFGGSQEPEPLQQQQQQAGAVPGSSPTDAFETGLLDMSAFGFGADMGGVDDSTAADTLAPHQQQQQDRQQAGQQQQQPSLGGSTLSPGQQSAQHGGVRTVPPAVLAKMLVQFPPPPKKVAAGARLGWCLLRLQKACRLLRSILYKQVVLKQSKSNHGYSDPTFCKLQDRK